MSMCARKILLTVSAALVIGLAPLAVGQVRQIDSSSRLLVHAYKSGLFSGFADNHEIEAPISEGSVDEGGLQVKFSVEARRKFDLRLSVPYVKNNKHGHFYCLSKARKTAGEKT